MLFALSEFNLVASVHPSPKGRGCLAFLAICLVGSVGFALGMGLGVALVDEITSQVVAKARERGVELVPGVVRFGPSFLEVIDARWQLVGVSGISGRSHRVDVDLDGTTPVRITVFDLALTATGDPLALAQALREWNQRFGAKSQANPRPDFRRVWGSYESPGGGYPSLAFGSMRWFIRGNHTGIALDEVTIGLEPMGSFALARVRFAIRLQPQGIEFGWGSEELEKCPLRFGRHQTLGGNRYTWQVAPFSLAELDPRWRVPGVPDDLWKAKIATAGWLDVPENESLAQGRLDVTLVGWVPPHPAELDGFRFSPNTQLQTAFSINPSWTLANLEGIEIKSGDFALRGHGRLDRELFDVHLRVDLGGSLSCTSLASAIADSQLGVALGNWTRRNAHKLLEGSVGFRVQLEADTRRLEQAKMVRRIGVGCGLKPITLEDLLELELPPLPDPQKIESLVHRLPGLLSQLPPPSLPGLGLPQLFPSGPHGKDSTPTAASSHP